MRQHAGCRQGLQFAVRQRRWDQHAVERIRSCAVGQLQVDQPHRADIRDRVAVPLLPRPAAGDIERDRPGEPRKFREQPVGGAARMGVDVEHVPVGRGIQFEPQRVAAGDRRIQIDQRAATANICATGKTTDAFGARHGLCEHQPIHCQRTDPNVERRQDRPFPRRGNEIRQPFEPRLRDVQACDVEPVVHPPQRCPVELGAGCCEHQPAPVANAHVDQPGLAVDRPVDPPDLVAQAVRRAQRGDPVGQEAMADPGIEQRHQRAREQDQADNRPQQLASPAPRRRGDGGGVDRLGRCRIGQNACPSET